MIYSSHYIVRIAACLAVISHSPTHKPNGFCASCFFPPILSVPPFAVSPTPLVVSLMPEVAPPTVSPTPLPRLPTPSPTPSKCISVCRNMAKRDQEAIFGDQPLPTLPTVLPTVSVTPLVVLPRVLATPPRMPPVRREWLAIEKFRRLRLKWNGWEEGCRRKGA
jgi:hypothetical protein